MFLSVLEEKEHLLKLSQIVYDLAQLKPGFFQACLWFTVILTDEWCSTAIGAAERADGCIISMSINKHHMVFVPY